MSFKSWKNTCVGFNFSFVETIPGKFKVFPRITPELSLSLSVAQFIHFSCSPTQKPKHLTEIRKIFSIFWCSVRLLSIKSCNFKCILPITKRRLWTQSRFVIKHEFSKFFIECVSFAYVWVIEKKWSNLDIYIVIEIKVLMFSNQPSHWSWISSRSTPQLSMIIINIWYSFV